MITIVIYDLVFVIGGIGGFFIGWHLGAFLFGDDS